ncbi:MAG: restriction endonuclease subunit S [Ignavibacteriales bacterium]|nr:restriction endonuclease subunit S [Ignavibacteriales bacterium]
MQLPKHKKYKESGIKWIGQIPQNWKIEKLRAVTELKSEKNRPNLQVLSVYREFGVIQKDSRDDNHNVTSQDTSTYKAVKPGDLVVNKMKAWQGSMGVSEHEGIVSPAYITCKLKTEKVFPKYLHYLLRSHPYIGVYNALSYGVRVGQWDMHYEDFKKIPICLPDKKEMIYIVNFIDKKFAEIDNAISKKEKLIELLKEQKNILINQAVTNGIKPKVKLKNSGVDWIGKIPAHWEVRKISRSFRIIGSGTTPDSGNSAFYENGTISWVNTGDLNDNRLKDINKKITAKALRRFTSLKIYPKDTLIIAMYGATIGKTGLTVSDVTANQACCCLSDSVCFDIRYLQFWFISNRPQILSLSYGGGQPNINQDLIKSLLIQCPPLYEQNNIVKSCEEITKYYDKTIVKSFEQIQTLKEFKSILISNVVTGKIKVT